MHRNFTQFLLVSVILLVGICYVSSLASVNTEWGEFAKGDINGDGSIRSNDAILALRIAAGLDQPTRREACAADLNGDDIVKANDAITLLRIAAGLLSPVKTLIISSAPVDAKIYLNGLDTKHITPYAFALMDDPQIRIRLEKEGHLNSEANVDATMIEHTYIAYIEMEILAGDMSYLGPTVQYLRRPGPYNLWITNKTGHTLSFTISVIDMQGRSIEPLFTLEPEATGIVQGMNWGSYGFVGKSGDTVIVSYGISLDRDTCWEVRDHRFRKSQFHDQIEKGRTALVVTSDPDGAKIYLNDEDTGFVTDHVFYDLELETYRVRVEHETCGGSIDRDMKMSKNKATGIGFGLGTEPTFTDWALTPSDLRSDHKGTVRVYVRLVDLCPGGNPVEANIRYQIGNNRAQGGLGMIYSGGNVWYYDIPIPEDGWTAYKGQVLKYGVYANSSSGQHATSETIEELIE